MHPTRNFVINVIEQFYGKGNIELDSKSEDILSEFISSLQNVLIQSCLVNNNVVLQSQICQTDNKSLIFFKNTSIQSSDDIVTPVRDINVLTLSANVPESLYHILKQVYSPILATDNDVYSIKVQKHLLDLESVLKIVTYGKDDSNTNVILSIEDELEYWKSLGYKTDISKKEKEAASTFCDLFQDVCEEIRVIKSRNLSEMREAAENIGGLLDDVWRFTTLPYSQHRMMHVFDIVGQVICSTLQVSLSSLSLWCLDGSCKEYEVLTSLGDSLRVVETWTGACKSLTGTYWPNYALHSWTGHPYVPMFCTKFESRLKQIHEIRTTHSQLSKLLSQSEKSELGINTLFDDFHDVNIWLYNGPNATWETAVTKFYSSLRPAEAKIAEKLKPRLHNTSTRQMVYELSRYRALISRPLVRRALAAELEGLVSALSALLHGIRDQLGKELHMYRPPDMSPVVHQIQWAKQNEAKVKEIQSCAEMHLKEFKGSEELLKLSTQLLKELKAMYTQLHEEWCRDLQAQAKAGLLSVSGEEPVVQFNPASALLEVRVGARALHAEREARALAALHLPPPPAARALGAIQQHLQHVRALHQVASFHNTLGERMVPSTRPLLLGAALELSALVRDQRAPADLDQLANYTERLKQAVLKLETQNSFLTSQHTAIRNIVAKLIDTELLAKQAEWKKGVKEIRDIIEKVESLGYKSTEAWRLHWDRQLFKALECQYLRTLLALHTYFPHVRVDLVLRGHSVRAQPPVEELRVQHYRQLRRLVALPAHFVGLQDTITQENSIFKAIVDKHSWVGNKAAVSLERALSSLESTCARWQRVCALACVSDLRALCTEHLTRPEHWENNFKACKAYGQTVAKMTFEDEKIEWISVGTTGLRRELEAQTRQLWSCLLASLHASCRYDAERIDAFTAAAALTLQDNTLPKNAKELAEISAKHQALHDKMPEMEETMVDLRKKAHMLRTWGGEASLEGTVREWNRIRELMISRQQSYQHQAETVKAGLKGEWENLNTSVEAWLSRWKQGRAALEDTRGAEHPDMRDRCRAVLDALEHWNKFTAERDELIKECAKFGMSVEACDTWKEGDTVMQECAALWSVFKEYDEEFEGICDQEWIVFGKKLHILDELTSQWSRRLEPYTPVTLHLRRELDKYANITSVLKYLRGGELTERHWREVYGILGMEYKKPDTLRVRDLLQAPDTLKKHTRELQKISECACSEAAVRHALGEVEMWFAGARLTVVYYTDSGHRQTPIVNDYKTMLNKIEEQQWAVGAVGAGGSQWEGTLRAAAALLRAASHAQRRYERRGGSRC